MTFWGFIVLIIIAAICGAIAQAITGYSMGGCLVSTAIGFIGAIIGMTMARALNMPLLWSANIQGENFPIVWAILGAVIFIIIISLIVPKHRRR